MVPDLPFCPWCLLPQKVLNESHNCHHIKVSKILMLNLNQAHKYRANSDSLSMLDKRDVRTQTLIVEPNINSYLGLVKKKKNH